MLIGGSRDVLGERNETGEEGEERVSTLEAKLIGEGDSVRVGTPSLEAKTERELALCSPVDELDWSITPSGT